MGEGAPGFDPNAAERIPSPLEILISRLSDDDRAYVEGELFNDWAAMSPEALFEATRDNTVETLRVFNNRIKVYVEERKKPGNDYAKMKGMRDEIHASFERVVNRANGGK
jgi:hypothetical protein